MINADDCGSIDFNILAQGAPFPTSGGAAVNAVAAVPEPAGVALLLVPLARLVQRRRSRSKSRL